MDSTSLFVLFVGVSAGVTALWILLDWLPRVRDRTFRPRGDTIPRSRSRRRVWKDVRATAEEETIRDTLEQSYGRPTLRRSTKRASPEIDFEYVEALRSQPISSGNGSAADDGAATPERGTSRGRNSPDRPTDDSRS